MSLTPNRANLASVRRVVVCRHLNQNKTTKEYQLSEKSYNWRLSTHTLDSRGQVFTLPEVPIGQIILVKTAYGLKSVVVVKNMQVTGLVARKVARALRRVVTVTDQKLSDLAPELLAVL
ncbi:hypothetical protein HU830_03505 [Lactobacillus sp. DCY120]|uniref:Uncharacterized protein n=1 Tax=Bombilactobacillus apium TaxID=2675299 RepID=A0A850QWR0_9LACO|nr:DUF5839 family protein [Bombilactobacillus apium]NVY96244.1 hypothetical protein [Bombilactobacillus apium]